MAIDNSGVEKRGVTTSVRGVRIIDRSQLRGMSIHSAAAAFNVFNGAEPDYYNTSGVTDTKYGYGSDALALNVVNGSLQVSQLQYENGRILKGPITSGTVLADPRTYFDRRSNSGEPEYVVSGDITITIPSGQITNFSF